MIIALAQLNPVIGDFTGNLGKIGRTLSSAAPQNPDLVVFSEMFLTGYPPRDLLERRDFVEQAGLALNSLLALSERYPETAVLCGTIRPVEKPGGKGLANTAVLVRNGRLVFSQDKSLLPTYDVFDEARYFDAAESTEAFPFGTERLGITICEDAWNHPRLWHGHAYSRDPVRELAEKKATLIINLSASPYFMEKEEIRFRLIRGHATEHRLPFILVNQVGGNDELLFDGRSMAVDASGNLAALLPAFEESVFLLDTSKRGDIAYVPPDPVASLRRALVLGIRDYLGKCGFSKAVLGLSGGIDSAVVACLAAEALGPSHVLGIAMPSPYTSAASLEDAEILAGRLGIGFKTIPITPIFEAYLNTLKSHFKDSPSGSAEENIQARIRGNLLMAFSNKFGYLTLSTGNKSELSVGYCTLYGDMSGGLSVISDVPKTVVYKLADELNGGGETIPRRIIEKAPSAELKPGQKDQDTLPPYSVLDEIVDLYLEEGLSRKEIVSKGLNEADVDWVIRTFIKTEYKRRQAVPGLKVTSKAFGIGRRIPIAAKGIY
jgi:NAD+ synthase (glutamine-hydrolysing)